MNINPSAVQNTAGTSPCSRRANLAATRRVHGASKSEIEKRKVSHQHPHQRQSAKTVRPQLAGSVSESPPEPPQSRSAKPNRFQTVYHWPDARWMGSRVNAGLREVSFKTPIPSAPAHIRRKSLAMFISHMRNAELRRHGFAAAVGGRRETSGLAQPTPLRPSCPSRRIVGQHKPAVAAVLDDIPVAADIRGQRGRPVASASSRARGNASLSDGNRKKSEA